jgi:hypothetical protein
MILDFFQNLKNQNFWKETRNTEAERTQAYDSVTGPTNQQTDSEEFRKKSSVDFMRILCRCIHTKLRIKKVK